MKRFMHRLSREGEPFTVIAEGHLYTVTPIMKDGELAGAVIVSKRVDPELMGYLDDISGALKAYLDEIGDVSLATQAEVLKNVAGERDPTSNGTTGPET